MQRIVLTSSCSAIIAQSSEPSTVFSEQDWNLSSVKEVEEMGNKCRPGIAYCASKTLAEKGGFLNIFSSCLPHTCFLQSAAWDFYEQHKLQIKWDLVVINPPFVNHLLLQESSAVANDRITGIWGEEWFHLNRRP